MNVGIIGSGGRENSICFSLKKSKRVDKIFCMPGNAGTANISKNLEIDINNFQQVKDAVSVVNSLQNLRENSEKKKKVIRFDSLKRNIKNSKS